MSWNVNLANCRNNHRTIIGPLDACANFREAMIDAVGESDSLKDLWSIIRRHFEAHLFLGAADFVVPFQPLKQLFCAQGDDYPDDDNADFGREFPPIVNRSGLAKFQYRPSIRGRA
jgi:hypothetical protein